MKCPLCNGRKKILEPCDGALLGTVLVTCYACDGTGEVTMTNEEWMKTLDTEELVDLLYDWRKDGSSVERQMWLDKHKERIKMQIRGWLKEKHP